jgi:hypothetical protein
MVFSTVEIHTMKRALSVIVILTNPSLLSYKGGICSNFSLSLSSSASSTATINPLVKRVMIWLILLFILGKSSDFNSTCQSISRVTRSADNINEICSNFDASILLKPKKRWTFKNSISCFWLQTLCSWTKSLTTLFPILPRQFAKDTSKTLIFCRGDNRCLHLKI